MTNLTFHILLLVTNVWHPISWRQPVCTIADCKVVHYPFRYEGLLQETQKWAVIVENGVEYRKLLTNWPANVHDYTLRREVEERPKYAPLPTRKKRVVIEEMPPMPPQ